MSIAYNDFVRFNQSPEELQRLYPTDCTSVSASDMHHDQHKRKEAATTMSFLYAKAAHDGLIIASDSRATHTGTDSSVCFSTFRKIYIVPETNIVIGLTGVLNFTARHIPFYTIVRFLKSRSRYDIALELREKLSMYEPQGVTHVLVFESKATEDPECVESYCTEIDVDTAHKGQKRTITDNIMTHGDIRVSGIGWAKEYATTARLDFATVNEGIPIVRDFMENVKEADAALKLHVNTIGEQIHMITITKDGAREIAAAP